MKIYTEEIILRTNKRIEFVNITDLVKNVVNKSGIVDGIILINPMHITSSIFINDNENGLINDFENWLDKLAPRDFDYKHHITGEDNGFSHLWRTIMGRETTVAITDGKMHFGTWESIFYGEFDGQRNKKILLKVLGN